MNWLEAFLFLLLRVYALSPQCVCVSQGIFNIQAARSEGYTSLNGSVTASCSPLSLPVFDMRNILVPVGAVWLPLGFPGLRCRCHHCSSSSSSNRRDTPSIDDAK